MSTIQDIVGYGGANFGRFYLFVFVSGSGPLVIDCNLKLNFIRYLEPKGRSGQKIHGYIGRVGIVLQVFPGS